MGFHVPSRIDSAYFPGPGFHRGRKTQAQVFATPDMVRPNVIGFLGGLDHPVPLRQSEVNRILGTVDELQESGEDLNIPYTVGETVKVSVGPFSGFSGLIEEVNAEKRKLKVMVKIFGRKTPLELGFTDVEKE